MHYKDFVRYDFVTEKEKEELSDQKISKLRNERTNERFELLRNNGDEYAREEIVLAYTAMVWSIAVKYARTVIDPEELMADGIIALQNAITAFDPGKGVSFSTYAHRAVENEIMLSDLLFDGVARLPNHIKRLSQEISIAKVEAVAGLHREPDIKELTIAINGLRAKKMLEQKLQCEPSTKQVFEFLMYEMKDKDKVTEQQVLDFENGITNIPVVYLDSSASIDDVESHSHELHGFEDIRYDSIDEREKLDKLKNFVNGLNSDDKKIFCHSFGIFGYKRLKLKEIKEELDKPMILESISRRKNRMLKKLRS